MVIYPVRRTKLRTRHARGEETPDEDERTVEQAAMTQVMVVREHSAAVRGGLDLTARLMRELDAVTSRGDEVARSLSGDTFGTGRIARRNSRIAQAPLAHFFTKLAFAAPASGFLSLLTAASSQHFLIELVLAAPLRGFPSLLTALVAHDCAEAAPMAKAEMMKARARRFIRRLHWLKSPCYCGGDWLARVSPTECRSWTI
jgi:hypothetical protein